MSKNMESEIWKPSKPMEREMHEKIRKFFVKIVERFIGNVKSFKLAIREYLSFLWEKEGCFISAENWTFVDTHEVCWVSFKWIAIPSSTLICSLANWDWESPPLVLKHTSTQRLTQVLNSGMAGLVLDSSLLSPSTHYNTFLIITAW